MNKLYSIIISVLFFIVSYGQNDKMVIDYSIYYIPLSAHLKIEPSFNDVINSDSIFEKKSIYSMNIKDIDNKLYSYRNIKYLLNNSLVVDSIYFNKLLRIKVVINYRDKTKSTLVINNFGIIYFEGKFYKNDDLVELFLSYFNKDLWYPLWYNENKD